MNLFNLQFIASEVSKLITELTVFALIMKTTLLLLLNTKKEVVIQ